MQPEDKGNYWQPQADVPQGAAVPPFAQPPQGDTSYQRAPEPAPLPVLSWQASEYVHHEKQGMWFAGLLAASVLLILLAIFFVQSWTFAFLIVVMTVALIIFAIRQPRIINYALTEQGISINDKQFRYGDFRFFGVIEEGPLYSAQLVPTKRFMPVVNMYFPAEYGEEIVDMLAEFLPMHHVEPEFIDKLMRKLRF